MRSGFRSQTISLLFLLGAVLFLSLLISAPRARASEFSIALDESDYNNKTVARGSSITFSLNVTNLDTEATHRYNLKVENASELREKDIVAYFESPERNRTSIGTVERNGTSNNSKLAELTIKAGYNAELGWHDALVSCYPSGETVDTNQYIYLRFRVTRSENESRGVELTLLGETRPESFVDKKNRNGQTTYFIILSNTGKVHAKYNLSVEWISNWDSKLVIGELRGAQELNGVNVSAKDNVTVKLTIAPASSSDYGDELQFRLRAYDSSNDSIESLLNLSVQVAVKDGVELTAPNPQKVIEPGDGLTFNLTIRNLWKERVPFKIETYRITGSSGWGAKYSGFNSSSRLEPFGNQKNLKLIIKSPIFSRNNTQAIFTLTAYSTEREEIVFLNLTALVIFNFDVELGIINEDSSFPNFNIRQGGGIVASGDFDYTGYTVSNLAKGKDIVFLHSSILGPNSKVEIGWNVSFSPQKLELKRFETDDYAISIRAPSHVIIGSNFTIEIRAVSEGSGNLTKDVLSLNITVVDPSYLRDNSDDDANVFLSMLNISHLLVIIAIAFAIRMKWKN